MKLKSVKSFNTTFLIIIPLLILSVLVAYSVNVYRHYRDINKLTPKAAPLSKDKQKLFDNGNNFLLYSFSEDPMKRKKIFKSDINGQEVSDANIAFNSYEDHFLSTRDGKYIAKFSQKTLEITSAENISDFNKIVDLSSQKDGENIYQVIWSNDGTKLVYTTLWSSKTIPYSYINSFYIINKDGTDQKLVMKLDRVIALQGINLEKKEIYWFERGNEGGGYYNFTTADITKGSVKNIDNFCGYCTNTNLGIAFSYNFERAYFRNTNDGNLTEHNLANKESRILYKVGQIPQGTNEEGYFEDPLILSPNEDFLIARYLFKTYSKSLFYLIPLSGEKEKLLSSDAYNPNYTDESMSLSPDGRYAFFNRRCNLQIKGCAKQSGSYIIDLLNNKTTLFKAGKESLNNGYCSCELQAGFLTWFAQ